ncbi:MAG: protein-disulfide reductase DsbD domain-containing protein [Flavitalea sp.]
MKKSLFLGFLMILAVSVFSQSNKKVDWTFTSKKIADKTYEVIMVANIKGDYHMYAQNAGEGPVPTTFEFNRNPLVSFDGKPKEVGKMKKVYEEAFSTEVRYYEKSVEFVQVVKVKGTAKSKLAGKVEFMVCNATECLPPATVDFSVSIGG